MNSPGTSPPTLAWPRAIGWIAGAVGCFHLAYFAGHFGPLRLLAIGYVICLAQLARLKTTRQCFYVGLATGLLCIGPQLECFWRIFGPAAAPLWLVLAFWIAAFVSLIHVALVRLGAGRTALLLPFVWTGLEFFRSELYYLKFSWLNVGYAFAGWPDFPLLHSGMYGIGFFAAVCAAMFYAMNWRYASGIVAGIVTILSFVGAIAGQSGSRNQVRDVHIAGVQMEFPMEGEIPKALDRLLAKHPDADVLVLSEYTLDGPVPPSLKNWCRTHQRYLVVGGKDPAPNGNFYDAASVIGPDGEIVFRQIKSMPIQFFKDGLPAPEQKVWESPWGKIGICICYDLSYTRVTDPLIQMGAQLLIVPTMDVVDWGKRQHELHALVAPVRAAEYHVPIFRLASSGISQAVDQHGTVVAKAGFPGEHEILYATFQPPTRGAVPLDRLLARASTVITAFAVVVLAFLTWKNRKGIPDSSAADRTPGSNAPPRYSSAESTKAP